VGRRKHKFNRIRQLAPMCPHGRACWRYLANTTEPSIYGGDAVLRQITLTTCLSGQPTFQMLPSPIKNGRWISTNETIGHHLYILPADRTTHIHNYTLHIFSNQHACTIDVTSRCKNANEIHHTRLLHIVQSSHNTSCQHLHVMTRLTTTCL